MLSASCNSIANVNYISIKTDTVYPSLLPELGGFILKVYSDTVKKIVNNLIQVSKC